MRADVTLFLMHSYTLMSVFIKHDVHTGGKSNVLKLRGKSLKMLLIRSKKKKPHSAVSGKAHRIPQLPKAASGTLASKRLKASLGHQTGGSVQV